MKITKPVTTGYVAETKPSFTWGIKSCDIAFMEPTGWQSAMDGSNGCDCGCGIGRLDKPRQKRPGKPAGH